MFTRGTDKRAFPGATRASRRAHVCLPKSTAVWEALGLVFALALVWLCAQTLRVDRPTVSDSTVVALTRGPLALEHSRLDRPESPSAATGCALSAQCLAGAGGSRTVGEAGLELGLAGSARGQRLGGVPSRRDHVALRNSVSLVLFLGAVGRQGASKSKKKTKSSKRQATSRSRTKPKKDPRLVKRDRWKKQAWRLRDDGKVTRAITALHKALDVEREWVAELNSTGQTDAARKAELEMIVSLRLLGELYVLKELQEKEPNFAQAEATLNEALHRATCLCPPGKPGHHLVADIRRQLDELPRFASLPQDQRRRLVQAYFLLRTVQRMVNEGRYTEALPLAQDVAQALAETLGEKHPLYAVTLHQIADLNRRLGEHSRAESLYLRALEIQKETVGENHPSYAAALNDLAGFYSECNEHQCAESLYSKALDVYRRAVGEEHPEFAVVLGNLGLFYANRGEDRDRAEEVLRKAVALQESVLGKEHPGYALVTQALGDLCLMRENYKEARRYYAAAVGASKKAYGEKHPEHIRALSSLGFAYLESGSYPRARQYINKALEIAKETVGVENTLYTRNLKNLARICYESGAEARAEALLQEALEIEKRFLGDEDPECADTLECLGCIYRERGEPERALQLYLQALDILTKAYGEDDPRCGLTLDYLASTYQDLGQYDKAEEMFSRVLAIVERAHGQESEPYADALRKLAEFYIETDNYPAAESTLRRVLALREKISGVEDPDYGWDLVSLADLYARHGDEARLRELIGHFARISPRLMGTNPGAILALFGLLCGLDSAEEEWLEEDGPDAVEF